MNGTNQHRASGVTPAVSRHENRARGEPATRTAPSCHIGLRLLAHIAPIGLSLLITTGFTAALGLSSKLTVSSPYAISTCMWVFLWSLALSSCVTGSRS